MSKRSQGQKSKFGSLCNQLISMCQKSRNDRSRELRNVRRSAKVILDNSLTNLMSSSNETLKNEQNSHENFYRHHYENLNLSA